jgi:hypothetical protein
MDKRADAYVKMRNAGAYTVNDVRAAEGKPRIDHPAADAVLIPLNMDVIGGRTRSSHRAGTRRRLR